MRRTAITFAAFALLAGCAVIVIPDDGDVKINSVFSNNAVQGNGQVITQQRPVSADIDSIDINGGMQVVVRVGAVASVQVEGDSNLLPLLRTDLSGGSLSIRTEGSLRSANPLRVTVTTPRLRKLHANGSGQLDVSGLNGGDFELSLNGSRRVVLAGRVDRFDVRLNGSGGMDAGALQSRASEATLNGSGRLQLGKVQGDSLSLTLRGSGGASASGSVERVRVRLNGSGSADLADLGSRSADLNTNGSGSITASANQSLVASSNGSGSITVYGNPAQRNVSGKRVVVVQ
ncbi:MAG: head GIN domain-containing protein [Duganella sp.]